MPRTRAFEPEEILPKAMEVFWAKGYSDTSIDDLVDATGVSRYGLYGEWEDKMGLFLAVLDKYKECQVGFILQELETKGAGREAIENYFTFFKLSYKKAGASNGCLFVNTAAEFGTDENPITSRITQHFRRLEKAFKRALENARAANDVPVTLDPSAAAVMLSGIAQGLALLARAGESPAKVRTFVDGALAILD